MAKKKKKKQSRLRSILTIVVVFGVSGLLIWLFVFAERYLKRHYADQSGPLVFSDVPVWVEESLLDTVYTTVGGREFVMDENAARDIGQVLESVPWLDQVRVRVAPDGIHVQAKWRKPLGIVKQKQNQFYVDADLVILEDFPLSLPLVLVKYVELGVSLRPGLQVTAPDLAEALKLIALLDSMDQRMAPNKPLLREIDYLDMSNYLGGEDRGESHIDLVAKDGTTIQWGAELGQWGKYMELSDEKKLAGLYTFYKDCGYRLMGESNFINLRDSMYEVPTPTRGY
ncbi:MAG: hypothetical protein GY809_14380 [Planctomycetes bacterium]|nr:hypothetical protein [Planctomycetota bacterium]